jgi:hypothetical protein
VSAAPYPFQGRRSRPSRDSILFREKRNRTTLKAPATVLAASGGAALDGLEPAQRPAALAPFVKPGSGHGSAARVASPTEMRYEGRPMIELLNLALTALCVGLAMLLCIGFARRLLRQPTAVALPLAFCTLISLETVLLNILSLFHGLTKGGVVVAHVLIVGGAAAYDAKSGWRHLARRATAVRRALLTAWRSPITPLVLPLVAALYVVALLYAPNNYDSMTYHLARVVHWVGNRSVDFFATSNSRENDTGPGAEYLLLVLQVLTGTDRLANSVQTTAFVILLISINVLVRYMRAPRALRIPLVLLFGTVPSFMLQATTTQNDLCAAVAALAVVSALRKPLFGDVLRMKPRDGVAIGLSVASGYLIKPTALMFVTPFLLAAAVRIALAAIRGRAVAFTTLLKPVTAALLVCILLCGPHMIRKAMYRGVLGATESEVTFPLSSGWTRARRVANPLLAVAHHVPWPPLNRALGELYAAASKIDRPGPARGGIDAFYAGHAWRQNEDLAGAPFQFIATCAFSVLGLVWAGVRRRGVRTALALMLFPTASWFLFHWVARNNQWIARYHAPWFVLAVLSACWACDLARVSRAARLALVAATWGVVVFAVPYAWSTVMANELRPVSTGALNKFDRAHSYYAHNAAMEAEHTRLLESAAERSCSSIVLLLGNDDEMEYQLTWRAMQQGLQIHHSPGPVEGCLLYAPHGLSSERGADKIWKPLRADRPSVFVRQ